MLSYLNNFEVFFKLISYLLIACGFLSLFVTGEIALFFSVLFVIGLISALIIEETRWQLSERLGTYILILCVPIFFLVWKYNLFSFLLGKLPIANLLAYLILLLTFIKLFQRKTNKDWSFLFLLSFFEVLLAAGLSINPAYLASLILYLFVAICAVITFEIKKTSHLSVIFNSAAKKIFTGSKRALNLPFTSLSLFILIVIVALPIFFLLPRTGSANYGNNSYDDASLTGFSDSVRLGSIGKLKQSNDTVMRAKIEESNGSSFANYHWRGVVLDTFDNQVWSKSEAQQKTPIFRGDKDYFLVDYSRNTNKLLQQTIFLEPINSPVLFALSRPLAVQGNFQVLYSDSEEAINVNTVGSDRLTYKVYSDVTLPAVEVLRRDNDKYNNDIQRYLQFPSDTDQRISHLAEQVIQQQTNRYDRAKAVERYLQTQFGYTLELKAKGDQPLADFLFNVKEGHCEYFATAMAIMLRTQGIATRIVNGFQSGEYNDPADVFVIKQKDAHSWVEVYFPAEDVWIPFDPTPFAGRSNTESAAGILDKFNTYLDAFEAFWIQYFVAFDNQEQRSLFRSLKASIYDYQRQTALWAKDLQSELHHWWKQARGDHGFKESMNAISSGAIAVVSLAILCSILLLVFYKIRKTNILQKFYAIFRRDKEPSIVEFYAQMQKALARRGFVRSPSQTPMEFAINLEMPEAVEITRKYQTVRFGNTKLTAAESKEIYQWLKILDDTIRTH